MEVNYYILLELDPSIQDWKTIEAAIKSHQIKWSRDKNSGNPRKKQNADRYMELIPDMKKKLQDPETRRAIAEEAKKELKAQKAELLSKLDEHIRLIENDSTIGMDRVKRLMRRVGLSEAEVMSRLKAKGINVSSAASPKKTPKTRPKLDNTIARNIREGLKRLGVKSLYEFLKLGPRSSPQSLVAAADAIYKEIRRKGLTDPTSTQKQELAGHAKSVFKDAAQKERYDNTYAVEAMVELNDLIETAGDDSFIDKIEIERLLQHALQMGVSHELALEYIMEYANKRGWTVYRASDAKEEQEAEKKRRDFEKKLDNLYGLWRERKLEEARKVLKRIQAEFGKLGTEDIESDIKTSIEQAEKAFRAAESLRKAGKDAQAIDKYTEALDHCADFQRAKDALARIPPSAPSSLKVGLSGSTAHLSWSPVRTGGTISYQVRRKKTGFPADLNDGTMVAEVSSPACYDKSVPVGIPLYYSVFTIRSGVSSNVAANSGPHIRIADITGLEVEAGDGQVSFRWTRPAGCTAVEIWRKPDSAPSKPGDGTRVSASLDSAVDQGLKNGMNYGYLIVACFSDPAHARRVLKTPGVEVVVTPMTPPSAVMNLTGKRKGHTVILNWTPPARGTVQIRQTKKQPGFSPGKIISLSSADRFGTPIRVSTRGQAQISLKEQGRVFFIPLSVMGQTAVLGKPVSVTTIDEVEDLKAHRHGNTINLTWTWPAKAEEAVVAWKHDTYPASMDDNLAGRLPITRKEYDRHGTWTLKHADRKRYYFTVFVRDPESDITSSGAHVVEASGSEIQITYHLLIHRNLFSRTIKDIHIELQTKDRVDIMPAMIVVLNHRRIPVHPGDGSTIATLSQLSLSRGSAEVSLPKNIKGYVKLFFKDGRHAKEIRLMPVDVQKMKIT